MRMKKEDIATNIKHIAFIMDGNGRWAKKRGLPREYGHRKGAETFKKVVEYCGALGINATTFYVFSTENWKRPQKEVDALMKLLDEYLDECKDNLLKKDDGIRFVFIGDKAPFSEDLRKKMLTLEEMTAGNSRIVNLAINYGGRDEIVNACNRIIESGKKCVSADDIESELYTASIPSPDLIVRTAGEMRLSNFLMWQSAYSELYFTDTLWPDMSSDDIDRAVEAFYNRQRRYGKV